jgi:hypothetical protein
VIPDSPGDLSLWEWCEVPEGPRRGGRRSVRAAMVKGCRRSGGRGDGGEGDVVTSVRW